MAEKPPQEPRRHPLLGTRIRTPSPADARDTGFDLITLVGQCYVVGFGFGVARMLVLDIRRRLKANSRTQLIGPEVFRSVRPASLAAIAPLFQVSSWRQGLAAHAALLKPRPAIESWTPLGQYFNLRASMANRLSFRSATGRGIKTGHRMASFALISSVLTALMSDPDNEMEPWTAIKATGITMLIWTWGGPYKLRLAMTGLVSGGLMLKQLMAHPESLMNGILDRETWNRAFWTNSLGWWDFSKRLDAYYNSVEDDTDLEDILVPGAKIYEDISDAERVFASWDRDKLAEELYRPPRHMLDYIMGTGPNGRPPRSPTDY